MLAAVCSARGLMPLRALQILLARDPTPGLYYIEYVSLVAVLTIGRTKTNDQIVQVWTCPATCACRALRVKLLLP